MTVTVGCTVTWREESPYTASERKHRRTITPHSDFHSRLVDAGDDKAGVFRAYMSDKAPLAQVMLGREVGEVVTLDRGGLAPPKTITILNVEDAGD